MNRVGIWGSRILMCIILLILIVISFTGELVAFNDGKGWDGEIYYNIIENFDNLIINNGIDAYHMNRFFPFAIVHYILKLLNIPITVDSAIACCKILNGIYILLTILYFFGISKLMKWKQNSEIIAFSFAFFYVNVLKYFGYYPISTDCITTMLAFAGAYYYLKKSNIGLLVTGLISFITIPILSAVLFILALFPKTPVENLDTKDQLSYNIYRILRSICIIAVPALTITYALYVKIHNPETTSLFSALTGFRGARNWPSAILAIAIIPLFYYYATTILKVNWRDILLSFCNKKIFIRLILGSITFILLYYWLKSIGGESYFSMIDQFSRMLQYPSTDILIFLQTHFHFLGIFFLLFLLYWNDIVDFVRVKFGIGYFIIMLSLLIFIMEIETRKLICFYPFMLIPLISILNQKQIKLWVVFAIPIISLITSHFWYTFNVPGIEEAFLSRDYHSFLNYPAQRYYQFQGSFQSHSVYFKSIILEIILVFSIYLLNKKGLIYTI